MGEDVYKRQVNEIPFCNVVVSTDSLKEILMTGVTSTPRAGESVVPFIVYSSNLNAGNGLSSFLQEKKTRNEKRIK